MFIKKAKNPVNNVLCSDLFYFEQKHNRHDKRKLRFKPVQKQLIYVLVVQLQ